jgi:small subunit ribosomal protein S10
MQIQIVLKSYHFNFLQKNIELLRNLFPNLQIIRLPVKMKKWTVIRSPHVHKKSREQFELRTFSAILQIQNENQLKIEHLQKLICIGVQMQVRYTYFSSL